MHVVTGEPVINQSPAGMGSVSGKSEIISHTTLEASVIDVITASASPYLMCRSTSAARKIAPPAVNVIPVPVTAPGVKVWFKSVSFSKDGGGAKSITFKVQLAFAVRDNFLGK